MHFMCKTTNIRKTNFYWNELIIGMVVASINAFTKETIPIGKNKKKISSQINEPKNIN